MGGCRCSFRNCENSTQNSPLMHFFHFPFRDLLRCEKWAQYSNNLAFLQLPINQLRNKVVCETHFKEPCFMNIKRERLTKFAVPTLLRTKNGEIVDFEIDIANPTIYDVQTTKTSKYYEPLSKPIKLLNNMVPSTRCMREEEDTVETLDTSFDYGEIEQDGISNLVLPDRVNEIDASEPTPLNGITITKIEMNRFDNNDDNSEVVTETSPTLTKLKRKVQPIVKKKVRQEPTTIKDMSAKTDYDEESIEFYEYHPKRSKMIESVPSDVTTVISKLPETAVDKTLFLETVEKQSKEIVDLKKIIAEKLDKLEGLHKQSKAQTSVVLNTPDKPPRNIIEAGPTKTKIQLFNGIKKYLNPSMVALLRMEMFGDIERQYKLDEKSLAVELLNVQSNISEYMRSELRFRLPPKKDAECWAKEMSENGREIDWEDEF